ncbi:MerR family transcriptional regulator [Paracrocinitomix mangrovi]|uniref:MerR family transcriptional regulator n=1 Tax=Paracrocinitomix mangrovi TaxID=2862509 RepID=UPI001C8DDE7C|nr:MerR family transcriptional regulator [Paracrocinitomix mangrovi]UKN01497.1 MerR family transcriptional regulator [Paracrocinitomix mangrovi]
MSKLYYSIGEVAKMFDVNASLIRFWEKEFSLIKPKKNKKGNRLFTEKDIENFRRIYELVKEKGYTLDGAKVALKNKDVKTTDQHDIIAKLEQVKRELNKLKNDL